MIRDVKDNSEKKKVSKNKRSFDEKESDFQADRFI